MEGAAAAVRRDSAGGGQRVAVAAQTGAAAPLWHEERPRHCPEATLGSYIRARGHGEAEGGATGPWLTRRCPAAPRGAASTNRCS